LGGLLGGEQKETFEVPKDVAALVEGLKVSTENTLNQAIGRLDVEVPPGYKLGVEGEKKKDRLLDDKILSGDPRQVERSDRELARIFVEMLQPIADGLVVVFRTKKLVAAAKKAWKLADEEATVISFPEKSKSAFAEEFGTPMQFERALKRANCKCLLVVAPYLDQLRLVKQLSDNVKDSMGIMLLNARIHGINRKMLKLPPSLKRELQATFVPSYHVRFLNRKNSLLFHMMGKEGPAPWIVAQQRELIGGQPVTQEVLRADAEPTAPELDKAFTEYDSKEQSAADKFLDLVDKDKISR